MGSRWGEISEMTRLKIIKLKKEGITKAALMERFGLSFNQFQWHSATVNMAVNICISPSR